MMTLLMNIKRIHYAIIANQCVGILFVNIFENNILLNYFTNMGLSAALVLFLLSMPDIFNFLIIIPSAYLSDKMGIKKIGFLGLFLMEVSIGILVLTHFFDNGLLKIVAIIGVILYSLGRTIYTGSWSALINPHIDPKERGRFLAKMSLYLRLISIVFTFITAKALSHFPGHDIYFYIFVFIGLTFLHRFYTYKIIPEVPSSKPAGDNITSAI